MSISAVGEYGYADLFEQGSTGEIGDIVGDLEVTVCASTLGMDDTLGDAFSVEVSEEIDMVEVYG